MRNLSDEVAVSRGPNIIHFLTVWNLVINNIHEKLLDFDWLRAVQFKCNTSAKRVTPVQFTNKSKNFKTN